MAWTRTWLRIALGVGMGAAACGDDGGSPQSDGTTEAGSDTNPTPPDPDSTGNDSNDDDGCVPGNQGCACLDGVCVGGLYCVEDTCLLGPQVDIDEDLAVLAGLVVPIEAEVMAEEFSWSQVAGPPVEILGAETLQIAVPVPVTANPGDIITLRLTAVRNTVSVERDIDIEVIDVAVEDFLAAITDPTELGSTEGIGFGPQDVFVVSTEGFVSRFDDQGTFLERYDVVGAPAGANFSGENLVIANGDGTGRVQLLNSVSGNLSSLFDTYDGGPVGAVNLPLPDTDGNVYVSTRLDQRVIRYDAELGSASLFLEDAGIVNPNAMAFGPEGNAIYVGSVGHVWRVPLVEGGGAGTPEDYLDLGDDTGITYEVDGLVFDEGNNLYVGCPNASTLFIARYSLSGPTQIEREIVDPAPGRSRFINLTHGRGDFGGRSLYWTNLGDGSVSRMQVGLGRVDAPLAN